MSRFQTTVWSMVLDAGDGRSTAVEQLVVRYRPAVVRFSRARGLSPADAEDVAQDVFLRLFEQRVLTRADPARGRFRSLLLAVTRHVIARHAERRAARKRGGGRAPVSLDHAADDGFRLGDALATEARDELFDREFLACLLARALRRLQEQNPSYHEAIAAFLLEERSQREIARELGVREGDVRNRVSRGRAKLARLLRDEVEGYASSPGEFEDELRYLSSLLDRREG